MINIYRTILQTQTQFPLIYTYFFVDPSVLDRLKLD